MELEHETELVRPGETYASITDHISAIILQRTPWSWYLGVGLALLLFLPYLAMVAWLLFQGTGIWGINIPVAWGFAIINFVWWIGIGHAGTFISAILLLCRARWRTSINRFAEAMTLFALINAGLLPLLHLGRPWLFYWMLPYPNTMDLWPQFRSPLLWDLVAVLTYFIVSLLFWYMGLIPDMATLRDRAEHGRARQIYGALSLGWVGSAADWHHYEKSYFFIAALATPLVISVHSIVGMDFAYGLIPGWHSTLSPPFFVAGAIFSGFAMVLVLAIPLRALYRLDGYITMHHLDNLGKFLLGTGLLVAFGYVIELFSGWYTNSVYEEYLVLSRLFGPYAILYYGMIVFNVLVPQLLWFRRFRHSQVALFGISLLVLAGMWLERFMIVSASLARDFLPSAWGLFVPTVWDLAMFAGSIGLFLILMFLFIRFVPLVSLSEMRELVAESEKSHEQNIEVAR